MLSLQEVGPFVVKLPQPAWAVVQAAVKRLNPKQSEPQLSDSDKYWSSLEGMGGRIDRAREEGFTIIYGSPHTLLLDLDDGGEMHEPSLELLCALVGELPMTTRWPSKSGKGTHVVLRFAKATFTPAEALVAEVILGSDPKRALLYLKRLQNGVPEPRVLFMPPTPAQMDGEGVSHEAPYVRDGFSVTVGKAAPLAPDFLPTHESKL